MGFARGVAGRGRTVTHPGAYDVVFRFVVAAGALAMMAWLVVLGVVSTAAWAEEAIHLRPALIQELAWRPESLGASSLTEPAKVVVFSFYNGELFQIAINYDRYQTED